MLIALLSTFVNNVFQLDEIELCPNCYYMSNAKPEDWFAQPCVSIKILLIGPLLDDGLKGGTPKALKGFLCFAF